MQLQSQGNIQAKSAISHKEKEEKKKMGEEKKREKKKYQARVLVPEMQG